MRIADFTGKTDAGRKRRRNEDALVARPPLFAVADGMGGPKAGEVASSLATAAVKSADAGGAGRDRVVALIQEANRRVYERSAEDAAVSGMGTTMTVALVEDGNVTIGHVGDSRAYLVRDGSLEQLTEDHSLVSELVRAGKLSPEEAENHPQRSVITRALGTDPDVDVDVFVIAARQGDLFLLCSDGLTTMVGDETILRVLEEHRGALDRAAKELVRLANRAGGEDNITVVAFEVAESAQPAAVEETKPMPAVSDEEDTLTEADRVPAVDTIVVPPEDAAQLQVGDSEQSGRKRRRLWPLALLLVLIMVAAAAVWYFTR
jgi:PPM family protein phosphatase